MCSTWRMIILVAFVVAVTAFRMLRGLAAPYLS